MNVGNECENGMNVFITFPHSFPTFTTFITLITFILRIPPVCNLQHKRAVLYTERSGEIIISIHQEDI
jgi:hypothetical protein